ncbi:MAG: hypothetical protein IJW82_05780 [Clostridia bacterium]|nr:hypothetical protein [Clostridia bacterium]
MEKFNDEKIITDLDAINYTKEISENQDGIKIFEYFENKIEVQNIINIVSLILSFIEEEKKLLTQLQQYISNAKQNETKVKIRVLQEQENSLKLLYELNETQKLSFVKINQSRPLLKNAIDIVCRIIKNYLNLNNFEMNTKIKEIIKNYIDEVLDIVFFLTDFLV